MGEDVGLVKAPRICEMIREESGYGFNLHGEKGVIGQYISAIDPGSAAEKSGLCVGDRVVEVNEVNVEAMSHGEVVQQIRTDPKKAILLVVDKITDNYLKKINRPVTSALATYTTVHEITIEEAEKLQELRLQAEQQQNVTDDADDDGNTQLSVEDENVELQDSDSLPSNGEEPENEAPGDTPESEKISSVPGDIESPPLNSHTSISPEPEEPTNQDPPPEESQPEESQPDENISQPDENISQPDENISQPDENISQPDENISQPDENISQPDENISQPDENISQPDENISQPDENISQPDENISQPDENISQPDENISQPEDPDYAILESPPPEKRSVIESSAEKRSVIEAPQDEPTMLDSPQPERESAEPVVPIEQQFSVLEGKSKKQPPIDTKVVEKDSNKESKKDSFKKMFMKTPKRKEVKQNSDWRSKLDEFNNL
ncbi:uncharacterized protein [Clytia hemisphaerica]|uniref:uncharacterized protein isoform X2 n=1 Tax=Clytia hemisphaerica TaxID=252671 RepID=UPI0034D3CC72